MAYSDFKVDDDYVSKQTGSAIEVVILEGDDPGEALIGAATTINHTDDFETVPIEEAGQPRADEIAQGRHSGSGTVQSFWTPEWNDRLPTSQNFIGREFTILERKGLERPFEETVVNAFDGVKISRVASSHGARGAKTVDLAFSYERRYNGEEWADLSGNA